MSVMSETAFYLFHEIFLAGTELLYAVLFTLFFKTFLPDQKQKWRTISIIFIIYIFFEVICNRAAFPQGSFGLILPIVLLAAANYIGLAEPAVFLLTLLYFSVKVSGGLMVQSLYFVIERLLPFDSGVPEEIYFHTAITTLLFWLSHVLVMAVMLVILSRQMRKQKLLLKWREVCYISLVPVAGILFGQMLARILIEFKDGILLQLYERHPVFLAVVPILAMLFYAGTYLAVVSWQGMTTLREEQAAHYAEYEQVKALQARIQEAEQFYAGIRQVKHEMRSHLTNIKGLAKSGEYAGLQDYIASLHESMNDFELALQTGNPVTDVIVNDIGKQCQELGIHFQTEFCYPASENYDAFDIGIILKNLLQNAVEACGNVREGERFIRLSGRKKGHFFLLEVRNSFVGDVVFGPEGLPLTTKQEDLFQHGIGLWNVRREAEKYMGELELKTEQQEFFAAVLLQERSRI